MLTLLYAAQLSTWVHVLASSDKMVPLRVHNGFSLAEVICGIKVLASLWTPSGNGICGGIVQYRFAVGEIPNAPPLVVELIDLINGTISLRYDAA